jgi:uncharacterized protein (DUF433 family)
MNSGNFITAGAPMSLTSSVVKIDPEILGGTPCFADTRVPIKTLFDYVEGGDTIDTFLEQFPSVRREQAVQLLEDSRRALLAA